jgi:hypothetical protein
MMLDGGRTRRVTTTLHRRRGTISGYVEVRTGWDARPCKIDDGEGLLATKEVKLITLPIPRICGEGREHVRLSEVEGDAREDGATGAKAHATPFKHDVGAYMRPSLLPSTMTGLVHEP